MNTVDIERSEQSIPLSGLRSKIHIFDQLRSNITKIFRESQNSEMYLDDVAENIKEKMEVFEEVSESDLVLAQYLLQEIKEVDLFEREVSLGHVKKIVQTFFKHICISISSAQLQTLSSLLLNMNEIVNKKVLVANLWRSYENTYDCYCRKSEQKKEELCYKCGRRTHIHCFWPKEYSERYFECSVCFLKHCMPHRPVDQILFLGHLPSGVEENPRYQIDFYFDTTRPQKQLVELRCLRLSQKNRFEQTFPDKCSVSLNGRKVATFDPLPENSASKRRVDEPLQIDRNQLKYLNSLKIEEDHSFKQKGFSFPNHLVMVVLVHPLPFARVIKQSLISNRFASAESKEFLKTFFRSTNKECEISKLSVSMLCQYFGNPIRVPVRSVQCTTHYNPFELSNFIEASLRANNCVQSWCCPICRKRAYDLVIDGFIEKLLIKYGDLKEIAFNKEGIPISVQQYYEQPDEDEKSKESRMTHDESYRADDPKKRVKCEYEVDLIETFEEKRQREAIFAEQSIVVIDLESSIPEKVPKRKQKVVDEETFDKKQSIKLHSFSQKKGNKRKEAIKQSDQMNKKKVQKQYPDVVPKEIHETKERPYQNIASKKKRKSKK